MEFIVDMKKINFCFKLKFILLFVLFLTSCASVMDQVPDEEVLNISDNIYEILDVDRRGIFGSESSLINGVVLKANKFAETKDKSASPLSARIHRVGILGDWAWFYYKFILVDKNSPESYRNLTDITIERDPRLSTEFFLNRNKIENKSVYDEILKLDELRKKGLLTDSEFEEQKNRFLNN